MSDAGGRPDGRRGPRLWLIGASLVAFVAFVVAYEAYAGAAAERRTRQYGQFLQAPLWDLDRDSALEYLRLIVGSGSYRALRVYHADGQLFAGTEGLPYEGPPDRLLASVGLVRERLIRCQLRHHDEAIGYLEADWVNRNAYVHGWAALLLVLLVTVAQYYLDLARSRRQLQRRNEELRREVAERRRAEEALRQSQKMEAIGQLTAGIAHNFNNMLMVIMGGLELIESEYPEKESSHLRCAMEAAQRAAEMVSQLLLVARRTSHAEPQRIEVGDLVTATASICRRTFDRRIELVTQVLPDCPAVLGNATELQQAVLNLCLNARDAVSTGDSAGPRVEVAVAVVEAAPAPTVDDPLPAAGAYLRIQVADNGIGMDAETRERAFEPFFTTKDVGEGTGLGLTTAYAIARDHGGWVDCQSSPGHGTTFSVFLPLAPPAAAASEPRGSEVPSRPCGTETVLVVDDEEGIRSTVRSALEGSGYRVLEAADGAAALAAAEAAGPRLGLVLLDVSMPGLTGAETLDRLHRLDPSLRVLMFTGHAPGDGEYDGALGVVRKPVRGVDLLGQVRSALDGERPQKAARGSQS